MTLDLVMWFSRRLLRMIIDARWAFGVGARVSAQTGADSLGSGEWQIMPGLGVRYMLFELGPDSYFVPSMRWA